MVRIIFGILFTTLCLRAFAQDNVRNCVLTVAYLYEGVRETEGPNRSPEITKFREAIGTTVPEGSPWCAIYVSYCLKKCEVKAPYSAWSPALFPDYATVYRNGVRTNDVLKKADIFGIYFTRLGRIAHVGFIVEDRFNFAKTIEGNTNNGGSRDGDGVYTRIRPKSQIAKIARYYE